MFPVTRLALAAPRQFRIPGANLLRIQYRRIGGIRFLRIGKLSFSVCVTDRPLISGEDGHAPFIVR